MADEGGGIDGDRAGGGLSDGGEIEDFFFISGTMTNPPPKVKAERKKVEENSVR
jgi:hypothetical protein